MPDFEPYRIKAVEAIPQLTAARRRAVLRRAHYNPFLIPASAVSIDLISDSGTSAMSAEQWAQALRASEAFAFQESYEELVRTARRVTGFPHIIPVHQGRAAEHILFRHLLRPGELVVGNSFFETTEENIRATRAQVYPLPGKDPSWGGDINLEILAGLLKTGCIRFVLLTATSNTDGGQPVNLDNVRRAAGMAHRAGARVILDACRFAENAYLNKNRLGLAVPVAAIARKIFDAVDYVYMSSKKDGLANTGGFIGTRQRRVFEELNERVLRYEGFTSHGGLAGRDLATMAQGLTEALDDRHLAARADQIRRLGQALKKAGVPVHEPFGGHAVAVKTGRLNVPFAPFALAAEVFARSGVRGGVFGNDYRLAVPQRVYTDNHLLFAGAAVAQVYRGGKLPGLALTFEPRRFFSFSARFRRDAACRGTGSRARRRAGSGS